MSCGIVVALPEELSTLTGHKPAQGECLAIAADILLIHSGAGPANAAKAAASLISMGADRLMSWGCAAALAPALKPGALLLPERLLAEDGQILAVDEQWRRHISDRLLDHIPFTGGLLVESGRIVAESTEKQRIFQQTGAELLDMESVAVGRVAAQANLPFLAVRAIADPANMSLPHAVSYSMNPQGRVELPRLLRFLLTHPWELPGLIRLGLHFHAAQSTLKTLAGHLNEITQL